MKSRVRLKYFVKDCSLKITGFLKASRKASIILIILNNNDVLIFGKLYTLKMSFFPFQNLLLLTSGSTLKKFLKLIHME